MTSPPRTAAAKRARTAAKSPSPRGSKGVQSVDVGGRLLAVLVAQRAPMALSDIARAAAMPPWKAHVYLVSFRKLGVIEQEADGRYSLGTIALQMGLARLRDWDPYLQVVDEVLAFARQLGLGVGITVWGTYGPVLLRSQDPPSTVPVMTGGLRTGTTLPLGNITSRLWMAYLPEKLWTELLAAERGEQEAEAHQRDADRVALRRELAAVRESGLVTGGSADMLAGTGALCAPVFDYTGRMQLAIGLFGATGSIDIADDGAHAPALREFALGLSRRLGYHHAPELPRAQPSRRRARAEPAEAAASRGVQAIEVGWRLLDVLTDAHQPLMLRDLAEAARIPTANAHAYLVSFRKLGIVEQDAASGFYRLGWFALQLGMARLQTSAPYRMVEQEIPALASALDMGVMISAWGPAGPTVVYSQESSRALITTARAGVVLNFVNFTFGKLWAAFLPEQQIQHVIMEELRQTVAADQIDEALVQLRREFADIRRQGVAVEDGAGIIGRNLVAAPVLGPDGNILFGVALTGPVGVLDCKPSGPHATLLSILTRELSRRSGYLEPSR